MIHPTRIKTLNSVPPHIHGQYVLYIMQQSQRADYNHALEYAVESGNRFGKPVVVMIGIMPDYPDANIRHFRFMIEGLIETERKLHQRGIEMIVRTGIAPRVYEPLYREAVSIVMDRGYLRHQREWRRAVAEQSGRPVTVVESDAVVPVETAYPKAAYSAGILRPKIHAQLDEYFHILQPQTVHVPSRGFTRKIGSESLNGLFDRLDVHRDVSPVSNLKGGHSEANRKLESFIADGLDGYGEFSNDPVADRTSQLSPYLHFGQISPLEIALKIRQSGAKPQSVADFLEQLIIRRELSFNFVYYNPLYDDYECLPAWAKSTLHAHHPDPRPYVYHLNRFESARTHDPYWNAAMREMIITGRMPNYLRMYWGKKVLEWTERPEQAFQILLHLNNKYFPDGRDPNGYAGVAWCFGMHDRAWSERAIFGKVRYMNSVGLKRKFDMDAYLRRVEKL